MARVIEYLRISVTDRCNFNCLYCAPQERTELLPRGEVLSYEELAEVVKVFVGRGIKKVRLTGGEPLTRKGLDNFVSQLRIIKGLEEISLTTNGFYLDAMAGILKQAGLDRVNISIDTLQPARFQHITGGGDFAAVWRGVEQAMRSRFTAVKLNVILLKGVNEDEWRDFAELIFKYPLVVRFIEFFPVNYRFKGFRHWMVPGEYLKLQIKEKYGALRTVSQIGSGPAEYYTLPGAIGSLGFISGYSQDFCGACNRLRLNSAGKIFPCLFSEFSYDIKTILRAGGSHEVLDKFVSSILENKGDYTKHSGQPPKV